MARKEKSNYTQETSQWKRKAKPGRPKKPTKEQSKLAQPKAPLEVKTEVVSQNGEANISQIGDENSTLEMSRIASPENSVNEISLEEPQNNSVNDYDGMPKLSPITKTNSDSGQSRITPSETSSNNPVANDESSSSDIDKPFLKPIAGRTRRDRGRPRSAQAARKIAKTDSFEGTNSRDNYFRYR